MAKIHPTAIVDGNAQLGDGVVIGAYSIIKGPVKIGDGTTIHEHTHVQGKTTIGKGCELGPAAYVGLPAQHLHADREIGSLIVGDRVIIRETASLHRSTKAGEENATRVGDECFLMGAVHIAHDSVLENNVVAANAALVAGHCYVGLKAFLGGGCTLHQFVRIGRLAIIGGNEAVRQDVPPFGAVKDGRLRAYNSIGCRRAGLTSETIRSIRLAYRSIHANRGISDVVREIEDQAPLTDELKELVDFIRAAKRGIVPSIGPNGQDDGDRSAFSQSASD